ncbi:hypothetical protein RRG08_051287 [Elysia crispata]|uniref:Uncharacterized protein n=1 Tax=Elysia crispata TaxID=231223 RepID=A0AAE1CLD7_9GAST|nr:hypothetical protein RRG08_051287 [Elysia crispata]
MTEGVLAAKEKFLEELDLEDQFHEKLRSFTSDVKMKMRSISREAAIQLFEFAFLFLTQAFPDLAGFESESDVIQDGSMELRKDFDKLKRTLSQKLKEAQQSSEKLEDAQQTFYEKQQTLSEKVDAQQTFSKNLEYAQKIFCEKLEYVEEKLEGAQQNLSEKFSKVEERASFFREKVENNLNKILQATAAPSSSTTLASASVAATTRRCTQNLSRRSTFSARAPTDTAVPETFDTKLLPGGLVVLSDYENNCVKLYDWRGGHIHTKALDSSPDSMTVMDIRSLASWDLCVTLPNTRKISLMGVTPSGVSIKKSIKTSKKYSAIAAVTTQTLAVGYRAGCGIDLIDLSGRILHQLSSTFSPWSMLTTPGRFLMMSTYTYDSIAKMKLEDETIVFHHEVE